MTVKMDPTTAEKFKQIAAAFESMAPVIARTLKAFGDAAERAGMTIRAGFIAKGSKRRERQMETVIARANRRPSLIHNGRKIKR